VRILFHAINGTGLGHLMRLSAISEAVHARASDVHQLIATSANYEAHLRRLNVPAVVLPGDDSAPMVEPARRERSVSRELAARILLHVMREYDPDVVVFDTHAPRRLVREARRDGRETVLVLRRCRNELLAEHLASGRLADFTLILAPYTRDEFAHRLPPEQLARLEELGTFTYTAGVVFPVSLDKQAIARVAARHGLTPESTVVLITAGSGGYEAVNRKFIASACTAAVALREEWPEARPICVGGPYADRTHVPSGCEYVASEPLMQLLIARSDLTVAHAGYNSTQEILRTGARAVLVPVYRHSEDQGVLADYLARRGRVRVVEPSAPVSDYLRLYTELLDSPRPGREPVTGADAAATEILRLAGAATQFVCSSNAASFSAATACDSPEELARLLRAGARPAVVRIDWNRVEALLDSLGRDTHTLVDTLELDLGEAAVDEWEGRMRYADALVSCVGLDRDALVVSVDDTTGGRLLAPLAERLSDLRFSALVARVPQPAFDHDPAGLLESVNACRRLDLRFTVDIVLADTSFVSVDQP
jgi:predicted glycosyltransferase